MPTEIYNYKLPAPREPSKAVTVCISAGTALTVGNALWDIIREVTRKDPQGKLEELCKFVASPVMQPGAVANINLLLTELEDQSRFLRYPPEYLSELYRAYGVFEALILSLNQE